MDNASIHRNEAIELAIQQAGCSLEMLPPYSPDYNPIEQSFNVLKLWIKRHRSEAAAYANFEDFLIYVV